MRASLGRYRMVVTDIDGTLVDSRQNISAENKRMIRAFQAAGGIVTLATGRMEEAAKPYVDELGIVHPVILYNGGKIADLRTGEILFDSKVPPPVVSLLLDMPFANGTGPDMIFYSQGIPWVREMTPGILAYMKKDRVQCRRWESPGLLLHRDVNKILIIDEKKDFAPIISRLRHDADQLCEWVQSEPTYLEVLPLSVSKGSALKLLAGRLGIGLHEVIAIGDHLNDVEMIRQAGLGVAVDNAHPLLKAHARYVAKSHLEHAVAEVIEKFCFM